MTTSRRIDIAATLATLPAFPQLRGKRVRLPSFTTYMLSSAAINSASAVFTVPGWKYAHPALMES